MTDKVIEKCRPVFSLVITACLLISVLTAMPVAAQSLTEPFKVETAESTWKAPDLAVLPSDWWSQLNVGSAEQVNQRFNNFLAALEQRVAGLVGDELVTAQNGIAHLKSGFELLALARQGPTERPFDPPLSKQSYFLDDVLSLRAQHRELELKAAQMGLQIEQSQSQINLLQMRRDKLISEYGSENPEAPTRMLKGIKRITARVEYELVPFPEDKRIIDIGDYYGDYSKFSKFTGWQPAIDLAEGLEKSFEFYRQYPEIYWA